MKIIESMKEYDEILANNKSVVSVNFASFTIVSNSQPS